jgi:hypothetical protein
MYTLTINGATFPKVIHFRTSQSKLGQRIVIEQANGVRHSILISEINKLEIEREDIEAKILDGNTSKLKER